MEIGALGRTYQPGETIIRQGEAGDCMYVIQEGQAEVVMLREGREVRLAVRGSGEFFGEMSLFEHQAQMATVRALTVVRVLTVDQKNFIRRLHADPSLAYRIVQVMSHRIHELSAQVVEEALSESNGAPSATAARRSHTWETGHPARSVRKIAGQASLVDIKGEVTAREGNLLRRALPEARTSALGGVILNLSGVLLSRSTWATRRGHSCSSPK